MRNAIRPVLLAVALALGAHANADGDAPQLVPEASDTEGEQADACGAQPPYPAPVRVTVEGTSFLAIEVKCPDGTRKRGAFSGGTATAQGVPPGEDCDLLFKGGPAVMYTPVRAGSAYVCAIQGSSANCTNTCQIRGDSLVTVVFDVGATGRVECNGALRRQYTSVDGSTSLFFTSLDLPATCSIAIGSHAWSGRIGGPGRVSCRVVGGVMSCTGP